MIPLSSARVALVAGDVVGHGLGATATMGRLRTAVRTLADLDLEPDELMVHLDDLVSQLRDEPSEPEEPTGPDGPDGPGGPGKPDGLDRPSRFTRPDEGGAHGDQRADPIGATCLYAVYDPVSRRCAMVSAGHPPPAVAGPDGTVAYVPLNPGPPLGVNGLPFEVTEIELAPGSLLALYTDGLIEGRDTDLDEGMAELRRRLARPGAAAAPLRELGQEIISGRPAHQLADDVTLLLARTHAVPPGNTAVWPVAADPAAVARVRQDAVRQLHAWGLEELAFTTELVLSELVTNAIRHAAWPGRGAADPRGSADLRGLRPQRHATPHAPGPVDRRRRPRPVSGRPAHHALGQPLHPVRQDDLGRAADPGRPAGPEQLIPPHLHRARARSLSRRTSAARSHQSRLPSRRRRQPRPRGPRRPVRRGHASTAR